MSLKNKLISLLTGSNYNIINDATQQFKKNPAKGLIKKIGFAIGGETGTDTDFETQPIDLELIKLAWRNDSYAREALDRFVNLVFKSGYEIVSQNPKATEYIKLRLKYMSIVSDKHFDILLNEVITDLVKYNNCLIGIARTDKKEAFPPGAKVEGLYGMKAIGGLFVLPVTTFTVNRDKYGIVKKWKQTVTTPEGSNEDVDFKADDIIHMYLKKEPGEAFAYPKIAACLEDIRALREIEQRILEMMHKNINPMLHAKVGSKEIPGKAEEVTDLETKLTNMDVNGGLITTERVIIDAIKTSTAVIDCAEYLKYFEKRVFTGLSVSESQMGRGDSSNRSTSDNQKEDAVDNVKAIQSISEIFIMQKIFMPLLIEGGFDPINKNEDVVEFKWIDPDYDAQIKKESHAMVSFQSNLIDEDEARKIFGRDPLADSQREKLYFNMYGNKDTRAQNDNIVRPENQSGKKTSPGKKTDFINLDNIYNKIKINGVHDTIIELQSKIKGNLLIDCNIEYIFYNIEKILNDIFSSTDSEIEKRFKVSTVVDILNMELNSVIEE